MTENNKIEIDKELYKKLKDISELVGMPIKEIVDLQVNNLIEALKSDPLSELSNLGYIKKVKEVLE